MIVLDVKDKCIFFPKADKLQEMCMLFLSPRKYISTYKNNIILYVKT